MMTSREAGDLTKQALNVSRLNYLPHCRMSLNSETLPLLSRILLTTEGHPRVTSKVYPKKCCTVEQQHSFCDILRVIVVINPSINDSLLAL